MDTHPMVQGNDTLSDCLNGTFVTMNGNEVILQNDMGNRKINQAYLPSGYEPVGMKEYGGVIYVAAYNPITGKSQIGSFPSPQKKISEFDGDKDLKVTIDLQGDFEKAITKKSFKTLFPSIESKNYNFIGDFKKILPYSDKYPLHIGDKFCLYGDIKGFFDKEGKLLVSKIFDKSNEFPKNKLFNVEVGILNSENTFVNLTDSLVRWDEKGNYISPENYSEEDYNKVGCFIKNTQKNKIIEETISDALLEQSREVNENLKNTYQYKLSGPLCIKESINTFQQFISNIQIIYDSNETEESINENNQDNTTTDNFDCFDLFIYNYNKSTKNYELKLISNYKYKSGNVTYNSSTNLYTQEQTRIYKIQGIEQFIEDQGGNQVGNVVDFIIAPKLINNNGKPFGKENQGNQSNNIKSKLSLKITYTTVYNAPDNKSNDISYQEESNDISYQEEFKNYSIDLSNEPSIYLENLCSRISYDLSRIGSGDVIIDEWRTTYKNNNLELSYSIINYPKLDEIYQNFKIVLWDSTFSKYEYDENTIKNLIGKDYYESLAGILPKNENNLYPKIIVKDLGTGEFNITQGTITFSNEELEQGKVYNVEFLWKEIKSEDESNINYLESSPYWVMTTTLFNECYDRGSGKFIKDYVTTSSNIKTDLLTIKPSINIESSINTDNIINNVKIKGGREMFLEQNDGGPHELIVTTEKKTELNIDSTIKIDTSVYPKSYISEYAQHSLEEISDSLLSAKNYKIESNSLDLNSVQEIIANLTVSLEKDKKQINLSYDLVEILNYYLLLLKDKVIQEYYQIQNNHYYNVYPTVRSTELNVFSYIDLNGNVGKQFMEGRIGPYLSQLNFPDDGIGYNNWEDTKAENNTVINLISYGPINFLDGGGIANTSVLARMDDKIRYYMCAPTQGTIMIMMKNEDETDVHKKLFIYNKGLNPRIHKKISNSTVNNCIESSSDDYSRIVRKYLFNLEENQEVCLKFKKPYSLLENKIYGPNINHCSYTNLGYNLDFDPEITLNLNTSLKYSYKFNENNNEKNNNKRLEFTGLKGSTNFSNISIDFSSKISNIFLNFIEELKRGEELNNTLIINNNSEYFPEEIKCFKMFDPKDYYIITKNKNKVTFEGKNYSPDQDWKIVYKENGIPSFRSTQNNPPKINDNEIVYVGGTQPTTPWNFYYTPLSIVNRKSSEYLVEESLGLDDDEIDYRILYWVNYLYSKGYFGGYVTSLYNLPGNLDVEEYLYGMPLAPYSGFWVPCNAWF